MKALLSKARRKSQYILRRAASLVHKSAIHIDHYSTHYTTGYWQIDSNRKHPITHYQDLARRSLQMLKGAAVTVYTDSEWFAEVAKKELESSRLKVNWISIEELPSRHYAIELLRSWKQQNTKALEEIARKTSSAGLESFSQREKGLLHFRRELLQSGEQVSTDLLTIWLSKLRLTVASNHSASQKQATWLAWADASLSRCNYRRRNWDFRSIAGCDKCVQHYKSKMRYRGTVLSLKAGFLRGRPEILEQAADGLEKVIRLNVKDRYCHDEETLLHILNLRNPYLFCPID